MTKSMWAVSSCVMTLWLGGACVGEEGAPTRPESGAGGVLVPAPQVAPVLDAALETVLIPQPELGDVAVATTYTEHVRPILTRSCVPCHSVGQIAPFALDTYQHAKPFAPLIASATRARTMPPSVVDNSGNCNTFRDLPWLSDGEIETLARWSQEGAPEGDVAIIQPAAPVKTELRDNIHTIATPDYVPKSERPDDWHCFIIESPFSEPTFVTGWDAQPGNPQLAHHMVVFYPKDDLSALVARTLDALEPGPGYTCYGAPGTLATALAVWAPGSGATEFPDQLGIQVEPGRPLIVQMHYNTLEGSGADSTKIQLATRKENVHKARFLGVLDTELSLPPGQPDAPEVIEQPLAERYPELQKPLQIYGVFPHMHELGKTQRLELTRASGENTCLLDVPRWDFHWQRVYFYDQPITIDPRERLKLRCGFDTTGRTTTTKWGESTQDEMCVAALFVKL